MKDFLKELIFMDRNRISYNKFWANVGYMMLTVIVAVHALRVVLDKTEDGLNLELLMVYIGAVIFHKSFNTFIGAKYGGGTNATKCKELDSK